MHQVTIFYNNGNYDRFSMVEIPHVGEEVTVVHSNEEEETFLVTKVRHRAYRCGMEIKDSNFDGESAAMVWGELQKQSDGFRT
jgi:hypothetical protein